MIRGGVEYNLGIFITGVDKDSVADRAGLMVSVCLLAELFKYEPKSTALKTIHLHFVLHLSLVLFRCLLEPFTALALRKIVDAPFFAPIHFPLDLTRTMLFITFSSSDTKTSFIVSLFNRAALSWSELEIFF